MDAGIVRLGIISTHWKIQDYELYKLFEIFI